MKEYLMEGETIISQSKRANLFLTNFRIRHQTSSSKTANITSVFLDKISSIQVKYKSYPLFLILGILFVLAGIGSIIQSVMGNYGSREAEEAAIVAFIIGAILIFIFLIVRKHIIAIVSDGGTAIDFEIRGMKKETVLQFINRIEKAKMNYSKP